MQHFHRVVIRGTASRLNLPDRDEYKSSFTGIDELDCVGQQCADKHQIVAKGGLRHERIVVLLRLQGGDEPVDSLQDFRLERGCLHGGHRIKDL